jgi:hypothetical protein
MAIVPIENLGSAGIIKDVSGHNLPPEAWSDGANVRFIEGAVEKMEGETTVFGTPSVAPHWLMPWQTNTEYRWIYPSTAKVYYTDGTTHTDITRTTGGDYTAGSRPIWSGGNLHGVPIINHDNGTDVPQQWDGGTSKLIALTAWPASTYCKVIRPYRNFLVAADITKPAGREPYLIKWSHPADPGAAPVTWDETDATKLAGEQTIAQTGGYLVDMNPIGDTLAIYKEDAIWTMQFIGGTLVFAFREASETIGLLAPRCAKGIYRNDFIVGSNDIALFDGQTPRTIINKRMRSYFFRTIASAYINYTFVAPNYSDREMWVCFVEQGETYVNKALVWNYDDDTWSVRDLPNVHHIGFGQVPETPVETFDSGSGTTFDTDFGQFGQTSLVAAEVDMLMCRADGTNKFYKGNRNYDFDGTTFTSFVERTGLTIVGQDRQGNPKTDPYSVKFVRALYPKVVASPGATINIYVGCHDTPEGAVTWEGPLAFDPLTDVRVDCRVQGKFIAVRFEDASTTVPWSLTGYELDIEVVGHR